MIETEYTIEMDDYKAAQRLYRHHRRRAMAGYVLMLWVLPAISVGLAAWSGWLWYQLQSETLAVVGSIAGGMLWASMVLLISRWWSVRKGYRNIFPEGVPKVTRLTVDTEQIVSTIPGRSEGRFFWNGIEDYAENDQIGLLFVRKKLFLMVPRRALDEAHWAELRALVAEKRTQGLVMPR